VCAARPLPADAGLGELYIKTGNAGEGAAEAAVLEGRWLLARKDTDGGGAGAGGGGEGVPGFGGCAGGAVARAAGRGRAPAVLEAAFKGVLELDPNNVQARHNMQVLLRNIGRGVEGVIDPFAPDGAA
jgi:hypothetical protein